MNLKHLKMAQACLNDAVTSSEHTTDKKKWVHDVKINDVLKKEYRSCLFPLPSSLPSLPVLIFFYKKEPIWGTLQVIQTLHSCSHEEHLHDIGGLSYHSVPISTECGQLPGPYLVPVSPGLFSLWFLSAPHSPECLLPDRARESQGQSVIEVTG